MECLLCGDSQDYKRSLCSDCLSLNVSERQRRLQQRKDECTPLRESIKGYIDRNKKASKHNFECDLRAARVELLKERIATSRRGTEEARIRLGEQRQQLQQRRAALVHAQTQLAARAERIQIATAPIPKQVEDIVAACKQRAAELANQRRTLIAEILSFFPINPYSESETESRIIELILPNSGIYSNYPAELLSAALGYIAHVVTLATAYLGVVLPYPIEFAGARSAVRNNADPPRRYPLYGTRVADMDMGVRLLNCDIIYLCYSQGYSIPHHLSNQTLPNLMLLLKSPTLGFPGPRVEFASPRPHRQLPPLRVKTTTTSSTTTSTTTASTTSSASTTTTSSTTQQQHQQQHQHQHRQQHHQHVVVKRVVEEEVADSSSSGSSSLVLAQEEEEDDFIVLDNSGVPTPSQAEELAHFERAMFIDTS